MADNVAITAGSGTNVATDERTIASTTVHVQRVSEIGSTSIATGQASCSSTGGSKVSARETRKRVVLYNHGANTVFVGASGVATTDGLRLDAGSSVTLYTTAAIHAVCATSETATLGYVEEYD